MQKYMKDGKVAVLYSPGFGAGWYTWNTEHKDMIFDHDIVQAVLDSNKDLARKLAEEKWPSVYLGGLEDLTVAWLDPGEQFIIEEYDGSESIRTADDRVLVA